MDVVYDGRNYLPMLGLKLINANERGPWYQLYILPCWTSLLQHDLWKSNPLNLTLNNGHIMLAVAYKIYLWNTHTKCLSVKMNTGRVTAWCNMYSFNYEMSSLVTKPLRWPIYFTADCTSVQITIPNLVYIQGKTITHNHVFQFCIYRTCTNITWRNI